MLAVYVSNGLQKYKVSSVYPKIISPLCFYYAKNVEKGEKNDDDCKIFQKKSVILHDKIDHNNSKNKNGTRRCI